MAKKCRKLEAYTESFQISKMKLFARLVNSFQAITIFAKKAPCLTGFRIWLQSFHESKTYIFVRELITQRNKKSTVITVFQCFAKFLASCLVTYLTSKFEAIIKRNVLCTKVEVVYWQFIVYWYKNMTITFPPKAKRYHFQSNSTHTFISNYTRVN